MGAEADRIRNIHDLSAVAKLDGDETGYLLGRVVEALGLCDDETEHISHVTEKLGGGLQRARSTSGRAADLAFSVTGFFSVLCDLGETCNSVTAYLALLRPEDGARRPSG